MFKVSDKCSQYFNLKNYENLEKKTLQFYLLCEFGLILKLLQMITDLFLFNN